MGWGQGRLTYRALDESCKAHYPHTFGLKSLDFTLRLNLTVVRLVSGVPWAGKDLPFPFFQFGFLCRYSISDRSSAFIRLYSVIFVSSSHLFHRWSFSSSSSSSLSSLLSPAQLRQIQLIYYTSLDSQRAMQVKLIFARFNQTKITLREILGTRDYRLFNCCQGTLFGNPLPVEWFFLVTGS